MWAPIVDDFIIVDGSIEGTKTRSNYDLLPFFPWLPSHPHPSLNWKGVSMMLGLAALAGSIPTFLTIHTWSTAFACMVVFASGSTVAGRMHGYMLDLLANPFGLLLTTNDTT